MLSSTMLVWSTRQLLSTLDVGDSTTKDTVLSGRRAVDVGMTVVVLGVSTCRALASDSRVSFLWTLRK